MGRSGLACGCPPWAGCLQLATRKEVVAELEEYREGLEHELKEVEKRIGGKENMPEMMEAMMGEMLGGMSAEEREKFVKTMIGACIPKLFEGLGKEQKQDLVQGMLEKMIEELRKIGVRSE